MSITILNTHAAPQGEARRSVSLDIMSKDRLERILQYMHDIVGEADLAGMFLYASPSYKTVLGYEPEELLGRSIFEFVHGDDVCAVLITFDNAIKTKSSGRVQFRCRKADGEYIWMEATGNAIVNDGEVTGAVFSARDITERVVAEKSVAHNHALLHAILESSDSAVFSVDGNHCYTSFNKVHATFMRELYGVDIRPGTSIFDFMPDDSLTSQFKKHLERALRGECSSIDLLHRKEGRYFQCTFTPIRMTAGDVSGAAIFARDITQQQQNLRETLEQKQFLEALLDVIPLPVFYKNLEGTYLGVNRAFQQMAGKTREQLLVSTVTDFTTEDESKIHLQEDQEVHTNRQLSVYHIPFKDNAGKVHQLIVHKAPYFDISGNLAGVVGVSMDVTELKSTYDKLNAVVSQKDLLLKETTRQRAYFQQLFEASPDAIAIVGREGFLVDINRAFTDMFHYRPDEVRGRRLEDLVVPPGLPKDSIKQAALKGEVVRSETQRMRKDGSKFTASVVVSPILLNESTVGLYAVYRDISARKAAEARLQQLSVAVEQSPASIVITDTSGAIQYVNKKFTDVTGYTLEEVVGKNPRILKSGETGAEVYRKLWETITAGGEWIGELHNKTKFGELYWEMAHISGIKNENGVVTSFLAVKEDITRQKHVEQLRVHLESELRSRNVELEKTLAEMKRIQEGLIQSEKMASIGLLTAGIAHEINNPLAFVSSNLNRFKEYFEDVITLLDAWRELGKILPADGTAAQPLAELRSKEEQIDLAFVKEDFGTLMQHSRVGADRIKSIVEQLRGFSHMSDAVDSAADINKALEDSVTLSWNEIKYKATVNREYGEIPPVSCNLGELKQVFVNLLVNAAHAVEPMGLITLRTSVCDDYAVVEITDTGCGIPAENLPKIFDPFFTTKPVGKGTGLGLWISATIIQKHAGTISVKSTVGTGSTFAIRLPYREKGKGEIAE
ncbi:MAG: PAS domain S-box protein [Bacteroidetes bacterium]|nr:PAS domain S-box protein [Bacteroidota bacterium]MCW5895630.1 PAS domain S-box protein [Bacteroidota bacterium]